MAYLNDYMSTLQQSTQFHSTKLVVGGDDFDFVQPTSGNLPCAWFGIQLYLRLADLKEEKEEIFSYRWGGGGKNIESTNFNRSCSKTFNIKNSGMKTLL